MKIQSIIQNCDHAGETTKQYVDILQNTSTSTKNDKISLIQYDIRCWVASALAVRAYDLFSDSSRGRVKYKSLFLMDHHFQPNFRDHVLVIEVDEGN